MPSDGKSSHCLWQGELKMNLKLKLESKVKRIALFIAFTGDSFFYLGGLCCLMPLSTIFQLYRGG